VDGLRRTVANPPQAVIRSDKQLNERSPGSNGRFVWRVTRVELTDRSRQHTDTALKSDQPNLYNRNLSRTVLATPLRWPSAHTVVCQEAPGPAADACFNKDRFAHSGRSA
jgi:hypothetical protein